MTLTRDEQNRLVEENLAVVGYHVSEMIRRVPAHVQRDDLASAGSVALIQASRSYDPALGVPFGRYAATRVRGAIVDELRSMDWASRGTRQRVRRLVETSDQLTGALGRTPTDDELAEAMGTDVAEVRLVRRDVQRQVVSIDNDDAVASTVTDGGPSPEQRLLARERVQYLDAAVAELPERLRQVVVELFQRDTPVAVLAEQLGVTQSRISQLRSQALDMLRDAMNSALDPALAPAPQPNPGVAERRRQAYYEAVAQRAAAGSRATSVFAAVAGVAVGEPVTAAAVHVV